MHAEPLIFVLAVPLLLSGCGGGSSSTGAAPAAAPANVTVTIDPAQTHAISPYIYGINDGVTGAPTDLTFGRRGGNRWTAYNWETNASNAGSDYLYQNDNYLSSSAAAAEAVRSFIAGNQAKGMASLVTVQMQGLVAGDENGPVSTTNPPDLARFKQVVYQKSSQSGAPFTTSPPTMDAYVYMDEFLWSIDQKFAGQSVLGLSPTTQHVFAQLDNEPELWNTTHLEAQGPNPVTSDNYIAKTISLARALKDQFPDTSVQATSSNPQNVAVYASTDSTKPGRVIFVAINRSTSAQATTIDGQPLSGTAHLYQMTAATAASQNPIAPVAVGTLTPAGSKLTVTLPPLSVTTIDVL